MEWKIIEGLHVHPLVGTLGRTYAAQRIPVSSITIDPLVPELTPVEIAWPHSLTTSKEYSTVIAWSLRDYYIPTGEVPSASNLVGGLISYLNCLLPAEAVEEKGLLTDALKYSGIIPRWRPANPHNLPSFRTPDFMRVVRLFSPDTLQMLIHERAQQLGLLGVLLLLIGKSVPTAGYSGWLNNTLRTFQGVLGIAEDNFIWALGTCPSQRVLATLSAFLSANQPLRGRLIHVCLRAAASKLRITSQIFTTVTRLLRGAEMSHILLIDYYLFTKYPEILRVRAIRGDMANFSQAITYLSSIPEDERLYVKLTRPRVETNVLNRNNFVMLSAAAFSAAKFENPSMKDYRVGQDIAAVPHIDKIVTTYLTNRNKMSISSIRSNAAYLTPTERVNMELEANKVGQGGFMTVGTEEDLIQSSDFPPFRIQRTPTDGQASGTPQSSDFPPFRIQRTPTDGQASGTPTQSSHS
jgi:hypothetical protein